VNSSVGPNSQAALDDIRSALRFRPRRHGEEALGDGK
jgi:hypothetical protein